MLVAAGAYGWASMTEVGLTMEQAQMQLFPPMVDEEAHEERAEELDSILDGTDADGNDHASSYHDQGL